jgi:hypothetical protein
MLKVGDTVTFYNPGTLGEHESWNRGVIRQTVIRNPRKWLALHVVTLNAHKWDYLDEWGPYDGVPEVLGRETDGNPELEFLCTW